MKVLLYFKTISWKNTKKSPRLFQSVHCVHDFKQIQKHNAEQQKSRYNEAAAKELQNKMTSNGKVEVRKNISLINSFMNTFFLEKPLSRRSVFRVFSHHFRAISGLLFVK